MIKLLFNMFLAQPQRVCNILSLSGGGSLGVTEVSILEEIYQGEKYDMITGISAGALNALYLSYYKDDFKEGINNMKNIWFNITDKDIYTYGIFDPFYKWSIYDTQPLNNTITDIIQKIESKEPIKTLIGSTNLNKGKLDIFDIHNQTDITKQDILLSSSAIPIAFPPIKLKDQLYVDGGLITNEIIYNIKKYINCDYYNITFIDTSNPYNSNKVHYINGIYDYISTILSLLLNNFDVDIMKMRKCEVVNGEINVYYLDKQHNISLLDFNQPRKLFEYGKYYKHNKIKYCD